MKINGLNHSNIHPYKRPQQHSETKQGASQHDQIEISEEAKQLQQSSRLSADRQEKIEAIKKKIDTGQYQVDSRKVAERFYEFWTNK